MAQNNTPDTRSAAARAARRSDIPTGSWIDRWAPQPWRPFLRLARLDRPIGSWLLLWPCWWGAGLAAAAGDKAPSAYLLILFAIGAVAMRGAGCTYNDIIDKDIDGKVARTATRPIAAGLVSVKEAWGLLLGLCGVGFLVLIQLGFPAIWVGLLSLGLVAAYPFMKRLTYWPQAWLGLTFNWGALVGWTAAAGALQWPAMLLYVGGIAWTLGYDTIYAHQDKEDDELIGVKSAALKLGEATQPALVGFYLVALGCWTGAGALAGVHWGYLIGLAGVALHFGWQILRLRIHDHQDCLTKFKSNRFVGALLFIGILWAGAAV